jgi:hypothetical protein
VTRPIPAIVEPAPVDVALLAQQIIIALNEQRGAERSAERHESLALAARETAKQRRVDVGRLLSQARGAWPRSGPNAKGWGEFLARVELDDSTAFRYMQEYKDPTGFAQQREKPDRGDRDVEPSNMSEDELLAELGKLDMAARGRIQRSLRSTQARENEGDRDAYCTPDEVTAALPEVDLDPCSNPHSTVRARDTYSLEAGQDGLALPWFGLVYLNFPFSDPLPWAEKLAEERPNLTGAGVMCNADHSPAWWHVLKQHLPIRLDFDTRLEFKPPPGVEPSKNDRPQTLLMDEVFWAECDQAALLAMGTLWIQSAEARHSDSKGGDVSPDEPA